MKKYLFNRQNIYDSLYMIMIVLLGLQFALGMFTNLFVIFPNGIIGWIVVHNTLAASLHLYMATPLFLGSIAIFVICIKSKITHAIVVSVIGVTAISFAIFCGIIFVDTQGNIFSYLMAIGFIISLLTYAYGIYYSKIILSQKNT